MSKIFNHTQALCPECMNKVSARIVEKDKKVYLEKFCRVHGFSDVLICSDADWYKESTNYVKPKQTSLDTNNKKFQGCPESCGFCPEHQQHICLPVIEINSDCNLACPVCLKQFSKRFILNIDEFEKIITALIRCEGKLDVINLSGGEPTLHPELSNFLKLAKAKGIMQATVSTNGLLLLTEPGLRQMFRETDTLVALQFDGFKKQTYELFRGRDLSSEKLEIINILENEGIKYSLVATVANGINDNEITSITDFFFQSKAASLMFQPIVFTGRAKDFSQGGKITIPDVVHEIEKSLYVKTGDFNPLPCSHFSCFALAYYFILGENQFLSLKEFLGATDYLNVIANRTLPGLNSEGFETIRNKLYDVWSLADSGSFGEHALKRIQTVLRELGKENFSQQKAFSLGIESMKAIFIHDFMDVNTLDFGRLIKCCNPYAQPDSRFVPMCAQNIFSQQERQ